MRREVTIVDDNGDEHVVELPLKYAVYSNCEGHGTHLAPGMRYHAYTEEEQADWSEEDEEEYFKRGGIFDVTCETCKGERLEKVLNCDVAWPESPADRGMDLKEYMETQEREEAEYAALCRMEREMGC